MAIEMVGVHDSGSVKGEDEEMGEAIAGEQSDSSVPLDYMFMNLGLTEQWLTWWCVILLNLVRNDVMVCNNDHYNLVFLNFQLVKVGF